jgi:hypothetical protein
MLAPDGEGVDVEPAEVPATRPRGPYRGGGGGTSRRCGVCLPPTPAAGDAVVRAARGAALATAAATVEVPCAALADVAVADTLDSPSLLAAYSASS